MIRLAVTIAHKELRLEWRSRVLLWQVLPFAVMAMVIAGLAVGPDQSTGRRLAPGLLYLIITLVALQVIGRSHAADDARETSVSITMLGIDGGANYLGKVLALFTHLVVVTAPLVSVDAVLFHLRSEEVFRAAPFVALSLAAIASSGVLYGALSRGSASRPVPLPIYRPRSSPWSRPSCYGHSPGPATGSRGAPRRRRWWISGQRSCFKFDGICWAN